ncbi:MAG: DUF559 domain-containing protein [Kineosporiaceae bacterium]|nr:DUF559 domain-containing protein [Kineosporiaceae bacterium]
MSDDVPRRAGRQAGSFTRAQALAEGWTPRQVERRLDARRWRRVLGHGLTAEPSPDPALRRAWAAALTWEGAVVAHELAGAVHRFPASDAGQPGPMRAAASVIVETARRPTGGLVPVRARVWPGDVVRVAGLAVTSRERTAVDLLTTRPWSQALDLFAWLSSRQILSEDALDRLLRRRSGCRGTTQLRRLAALTESGAVSPAERITHDLLTSAGITGWRAGARIVDGTGQIIAVVDLLFEAERLIIEIDGYRAHAGRDAFVADRRRQNLMTALGYRVLRFTWDDLTRRPDVVIATIRRMLNAESADLPR